MTTHRALVLIFTFISLQAIAWDRGPKICLPGDPCMTEYKLSGNRTLYVERDILRQLSQAGEDSGFADFCSTAPGCDQCCGALREVSAGASCSFNDQTLECRLGSRTADAAPVSDPQVISVRRRY